MNNTPEQRSAPDRKALGLIFITILLDILGATILLPVQAFIMREYATSALAVGLLGVIYSAAQFLAAPILGRVSDRYGRRPVLLICLFGSALGYFMFGIGGALWVLFVSRLIDGITGGNISTAQAYIADVTQPQDRAKNFALVGVAFGLGFILGPVLAGALSPIGLAAPAYVAGALSLAAAGFGFFFLPESLPPSERDRNPISWKSLNPLSAFTQMAGLPGMSSLFFALFLFNIAFSGMINNSSVFLIEKYAITPAEIALLFTLLGIVNVVTQGFIVRKFAPKWGEARLGLNGLAVLVFAYLILPIAPNLRIIFIPVLLMGIGNALTVPAMSALAANRVSNREQGKVAGLTASIITLASVIGPLWAGIAYDLITPGAPYWGGAILLLCAWLLIFRMK